jgi:hypothetical protein
VDYISDDGLITKKMIVGPKNAFHVIHPRTGRYESPNIEDFPLDLNKDGFLFQESENSETVSIFQYYLISWFCFLAAYYAEIIFRK